MCARRSPAKRLIATDINRESVPRSCFVRVPFEETGSPNAAELTNKRGRAAIVVDVPRETTNEGWRHDNGRTGKTQPARTIPFFCERGIRSIIISLHSACNCASACVDVLIDRRDRQYMDNDQPRDRSEAVFGPIERGKIENP